MTRITTLTAPLTAVNLPSKYHHHPLVSDYRKQRMRFPSRSSPFTDGPYGAGFERPATPTSDDESPPTDPPEFVSRPKDLSDDDEDYVQQRVPRKKGGYDSRIEQIIYENEDLQILITDAGKSHESGGSYIAYTIRTGVGYCLERVDSFLTSTGSRSSQALLGIRFPSCNSRQLAPNTNHTSDPRETLNGGLRG